MTDVIINTKGNYEWSLTYTGKLRELGLDESNQDLLVFDGVTPGGKRFPNLENLNELFQAKSDDLSNLIGLPETSIGFMARKADGSYVFRELKAANMSDIEITNGTGLLGNPTVNLKSELSKPYVFNGVSQFKGTVDFDVNPTFTGPLQTNVQGDLEGNTFGVHTGALDVRGEQVQFDNGQIPFAALSNTGNLSNSLYDLFFPIGEIKFWARPIEDIPVGWQLADGTNGTLDCREMFLRGAGGAIALGSTGGSLSHNHSIDILVSGAHNHNVTVDNHVLLPAQLPSHRHFVAKSVSAVGMPDANSSIAFASSSGGDSEYSFDTDFTPDANVGLSSSVGEGTGHNHNAIADAIGDHDHGVNLGAGSTIPPYRAIYVIQRVALSV